MAKNIKTTDIAVIEDQGQLAFLIEEGDTKYIPSQISIDTLDLYSCTVPTGHPRFDVLRNNEVIGEYESGETGTFNPETHFSLTNNFRENAQTPTLFSESQPLAASHFKAGDLLRVYARSSNHGQFIKLMRAMEIQRSASPPRGLSPDK